MTEQEIFRDNLNKLVVQTKKKPTDIAKIVGVSRGTFSDWQAGRCMPRPARMKKLAEVLGVSSYDLLHTEGSADHIYTWGNSELRILARALYDNPRQKELFAKIMKLDDGDREMVIGMVDRMLDK